MTKELMLSTEAINVTGEDYDALRIAVNRLANVSEAQFESIKKEKWFNRVFDMITFSKKGEKRIAEQVSSVSQAQQILIELLLRLSKNDVNISEIIVEAMEDIRRIQEQNIYLLKRMNQHENIMLGICADTDIGLLSYNEKQILCACLYHLSAKNSETTDEQKRFANVVIRYLNCDVQMDNPTASLANMTVECKKKILVPCMEYLYLNKCANEAYDEYNDFINEFDLGNKTIKTIQKQINTLYNLRGCEGFYDKYRNDNYEEIEDIFSVDFGEALIDDGYDMKEEYISDILQIDAGDTKLYKHKNIHISAYINCKGNLEFDSCIIYYNETEAADEITLAKGANLSITNSIVICKGVDENPFIKGEGDNNIIIESSTFLDCAFFMKISSCNVFSMTKCNIKNCFKSFICIHAAKESKCDISDSYIIQEDLAEFYYDKKQDWSELNLVLLDIWGGTTETCTFRKNTILEDEKFKWNREAEGDFRYFEGGCTDVLNCTFLGMSKGIRASNVRESKFIKCMQGIETSGISVIDGCLFEECTNVLEVKNDTTISNCKFISCYNNIIYSEWYSDKGGVVVKYCQFINTKYCSEGVTSSKGCITFRRAKDQKSKANNVKKCIFDGVEMNEEYLIALECSEKPNGDVVIITDCDFRNCSTKRNDGEIIERYITYNALGQKNQRFYVADIRDCKGLDKVSKESIETV